MAEKCPICEIEANVNYASKKDTQPIFYVICPRCGKYEITSIAANYLNNLTKSDIDVAKLRHAIHKAQSNNRIFLLQEENVLKILENSLPKPSEQMNNFVIWLGDYLPGLGKEVYLEMLFIQAEIGAITQEGVQSVIKHLIEKKIVSGEQVFGLEKSWRLTLTIDGWEYYENLKRGSISSRKAFMAMQYGDKKLDEVVAKYFRPAVKAAGFELYRLDDAPKAGLIDDRLKVEIRLSRFLIADLTHENRGAYWEAGFAQGLGKPVIYTCEKTKFDEQKPHFDTNHHTTVVWDRNNLEKAAIDLKNTIRETLPEEAKLIDDE